MTCTEKELQDKNRTDDLLYKKTHLYCLLIVGMILLIFRQTDGYKLYRFLDSGKSDRKYLYMTFSIFSSCSYPLILTVAGTVLLQKKAQWKKYFAGTLFGFALGVTVYCFINRKSETQFVPFLVQSLFTSQYWTPYEVFFYILFFFMMQPFLKRIVSASSNQEFFYLLLLQILITAVMPIFSYRLSDGNATYNKYFTLKMASDHSIFFPMMGYWMEYVLDRKEKGRIPFFLLSLLCSICITLITVLAVEYDQNVVGNAGSEKYYSCATSAHVMMLFSMFDLFFSHIRHPRFEKTLAILAKTTPGVLLIYYYVMKIIRPMEYSIRKRSIK